ncbi:MAG: rRNA maturation RNase YbeY, partial [Nocardioidaceae bacterium]
MSVEVNNESGADVDEAALARLGRFVLNAMDVNPLAELSILLLDPDAMAALHEQWMDLPGPTDVMAFPMDEAEEGGVLAGGRPDSPTGGPELLGDIVLCP